MRPTLYLVILVPAALTSACGSSGGGATVEAINVGTPTTTTSTTATTPKALLSSAVDDTNVAVKSYVYSQNATTSSLDIASVASAGTVDVYYQAGSDGKPATVTVTLRNVNGTNSPAASFSSSDFITVPNVLDPSATKKMLYHAQSSTGTTAVEIFDPAKLTNVSGSTTGFTYSTLGLWSFPTASTSLDGIGGVAPIGAATLGTALPTTGTAIYNGVLIGNYLTSGATSYGRVAADATATANFAARSLSVSSSNSILQSVVSGQTTATTASNANFDLTGTLTWSSGTNRLESSTFGTKTGSTLPMSGSANGRFFGPGAEEVGGSYFISGTGGKMTGGFLLKK